MILISKGSGVRGQGSGMRGFTLIEIIITIAVLAIAIVGVLSVFNMGIKSSTDPVLLSQATHLAQGELDAVVGIKLASGFSAPTLPAVTGQVCKTNAALLPGFNCTLDICFVQAGDLNNTMACGTATSYMRIAATVTHASLGSVTMVTIITNY